MRMLAHVCNELFALGRLPGGAPAGGGQAEASPALAVLSTVADDVPSWLAAGQALMRALRSRLSGLAMPTYVLDAPDARGKIPVGPSYLHVEEAGT